MGCGVGGGLGWGGVPQDTRYTRGIPRILRYPEEVEERRRDWGSGAGGGGGAGRGGEGGKKRCGE